MTDVLDRVRSWARKLRDLDEEIESLELRLSERQAEVNRIKQEILPDLLNEAGLVDFSLDPEGNHRAVSVKRKPYYAANIAASWSDDRKFKAFEALAACGGETLIKVTVSFAFGRGERRQALEFARANEALSPEIKQEVNGKSLTAWVKERITNDKPVPDLETIGARIGQVVELKKAT